MLREWRLRRRTGTPWKYIVYTGDGKQKLTDAMAKGIEREESGEAKFPDFRYGIADAKNTVRVMREAPVVIVVLNTNGKSPFIPVEGGWTHCGAV